MKSKTTPKNNVNLDKAYREKLVSIKEDFLKRADTKGLQLLINNIFNDFEKMSLKNFKKMFKTENQLQNELVLKLENDLANTFSQCSEIINQEQKKLNVTSAQSVYGVVNKEKFNPLKFYPLPKNKRVVSALPKESVKIVKKESKETKIMENFIKEDKPMITEEIIKEEQNKKVSAEIKIDNLFEKETVVFDKNLGTDSIIKKVEAPIKEQEENMSQLVNEPEIGADSKVRQARRLEHASAKSNEASRTFGTAPVDVEVKKGPDKTSKIDKEKQQEKTVLKEERFERIQSYIEKDQHKGEMQVEL